MQYLYLLQKTNLQSDRDRFKELLIAPQQNSVKIVVSVQRFVVLEHVCVVPVVVVHIMGLMDLPSLRCLPYC